MIEPHVHVPYHRLDEYFHFIHTNRINLELYFASRILDRLKSSDILNLKKRLDYGPSFSMHAPFMDLSPAAVDPKIRAVTFERFSQVFEIAEILKPRSIVFHSGYEKWKYSLKFDVWLEQSLKTWKSLSRRAAESDLRIAVENVFEDEPTNLRLLMEEMGSSHFGICFDTGHFNLFSKIPVNEWLEPLKPYIVELHLHDNLKTADDHIAIGEGTFDFDTLFEVLKGRELVYTIEGHTPEDVLKSIEKLKSYF